jgi:hypothetical protein
MLTAIKAAIVTAATTTALLIPAAPARADDCRPAPYGVTLCKRDDGSVVACAPWLFPADPAGCRPWGGTFPPPPQP